MDKSNNIWHIRNVDPATRQRITQYAKSHSLSVGMALSLLTAPEGSNGVDYGLIQSKQFSIAGDLRAAYKELKKRYE